MKALLEGTCLEKFVETRGDKPKNKVRLYQKGEKQLLDITVQDSTYQAIKEGGPVKIPCSVGVYNMDGNVGMYASEVF